MVGVDAVTIHWISILAVLTSGDGPELFFPLVALGFYVTFPRGTNSSRHTVCLHVMCLYRVLQLLLSGLHEKGNFSSQLFLGRREKNEKHVFEEL